MKNNEAKTIRLFLELIDDPNPIPKSLLGSRNLTALLAVVVLGALWVFESNSRLTIGLAIGTSLIGGALVGGAICHTFSLRSWPIIKSHLSKESLNKRLREIET